MKDLGMIKVNGDLEMFRKEKLLLVATGDGCYLP